MCYAIESVLTIPTPPHPTPPAFPRRVGVMDVHHHALGFLCMFCFETGSHFVALAVLVPSM